MAAFGLAVFVVCICALAHWRWDLALHACAWLVGSCGHPACVKGCLSNFFVFRFAADALRIIASSNNFTVVDSTVTIAYGYDLSRAQ